MYCCKIIHHHIGHVVKFQSDLLNTKKITFNSNFLQHSHLVPRRIDTPSWCSLGNARLIV